MTNDDQIRRVLIDSLPAVDDQQGWERLQRRLGPARRRRHVARAAVAVAGVAALVVLAVGARGWLGSATPAVGDGADATTTSATTSGDDCLDPGIGSRDLDYLQRWTTTSRSLRTGDCVLAGMLGPAPEAVPDGLGVEMPLHPDRLADDTVLPGKSVLLPRADYYPIIHLGQVADTDTHGFLYWVRDSRTGAPTPAIGGAIAAPGEPMAARPGIWSLGAGDGTIIVYVVVPDEASIVAVELDGRPYAWQRPVARAAVFAIDEARLGFAPSSVVVTAYDRTGAAIDRYQEPTIDPIGGYGDFSDQTLAEVDPVAVIAAVAACMHDQGYDVVVVPPGDALSWANVPVDQQGEAQAAHDACLAGLKLPVPDGTANQEMATDQEASRLYNELLGVAQCLVELGYDIDPAPDPVTWTEVYTDGLPVWHPYRSLPGSLTDGEWSVIYGTCPSPVMNRG